MGNTYHVRISRLNGGVFASCTCPAGIRHHAAPLVCKHLAAVIIYRRALRAMRQRASH
jgi:uncharacterized Zn finger protein